MMGNIFDIKKFAVHDGDGIRTTVFFKGCPLKCVWCHNPEGIDFHPHLAFYANKCISCGACVQTCPQNAHSISENGHRFDREKCTVCGLCEESCLKDALVLYGKPTTVEALMPILLRDRAFYESSGGGVTLSGGECLAQPEFCRALLMALKREGIHTAVDTCGYVPRTAIELVLPFTDVFLYDIKAMDEDVHIRCTGHSNRTILENLRHIDDCGKAIEIRIPFVPGYNDDQIGKIALFLKGLNHITKVRLLPYHNYAGSKYLSLGKENTLPEVLPTDEALNNAKETLRTMIGKTPVL